jgi:hypothetical protein
VDRELPKVVLTGSDHCVATAVFVLYQLASECVEELYGRTSLGEVVLSRLANQCGVIFRIENGDLAVFGLPTSVEVALRSLREHEGSNVCDVDWQLVSGVRWMPLVTTIQGQEKQERNDPNASTRSQSSETHVEVERPSLREIPLPVMSTSEFTQTEGFEPWSGMPVFSGVGPFAL